MLGNPHPGRVGVGAAVEQIVGGDVERPGQVGNVHPRHALLPPLHGGEKLGRNPRLLRHVLHPAVPTGQAAPPAELLVEALLFVVHGMFLHFFIYCSFILKQWSL